MTQQFKEGYYDGYCQGIENVKYNLLKHLKEHKDITIEDVNNICDFCLEIDEEYLSQ